MQDIEITNIKKRSLVGIVALTSRTFLLQIIAFGSTFLLTIFLDPSVFGIFYVVSAIIAFLGYFSDIGLAAALIQKKEELTKEDLVTTFTVQQLLVGLLVVGSLLVSSTIAGFYNLDSAGLWLLRALIISFFLSSLKTIPSVLLERKLNFQLLVVPQILETTVFYIIAVVMAWKGYGVASFTLAVLARGIVGLIAMYIVSPWRVGIGVSSHVIRKLLRFGIPFQLNSFLALIKDDMLTIYLGKALPFAHVGYIGWAKKWAEVPLRLFMDSVIRVTFPAFSRIQQSKVLLGKAIEKTLFGLSVTIFPIAVGLLFFIKPLLTIIPKYNKWEPAVFSFLVFVVASAIASLSTPLTNALNAIGRIKTTLKLMVLWTVSTWVLTVFLVSHIGYNGVAVSLLAITSTVFLVVHIVKKYAPFQFFDSIRSALIGACVQFIWYVALVSGAGNNAGKLIIIGLSGVILYSVLVWVLERKKIMQLVSVFRT